MRGERGPVVLSSSSRVGSSPHARGTPELPHGAGVLHRFIPAYAGNASNKITDPHHRSVHPRMRGERLCAYQENRSMIGSSPHARGTRRNGGASRLFARFIPACAGNARSTALTAFRLCGSSPHARGTRSGTARITSARPVHPRMRGERLPDHPAQGLVVGSSPHARGTPATDHPVTALVRFIPACAGNASAD